MTLVVDGVAENTDTFTSRSFLDDPRLKLGIGPGNTNDGYPRGTRWVRNICLHTTHGTAPQPIRPGHGAPTDFDHSAAVANLLYWRRSPEYAGAHLLIDYDMTVYCVADLLTAATYHAGPVNEVSIGIEHVQHPDGSLNADCLDVEVKLIDWLTKRFSIQRQVTDTYSGKPIPRIAHGAQDVVGIYGHRDVTTSRGLGDPGNEIFTRLKAAGYEHVDFQNVDLTIWKARQLSLGIPAADCDGVPGPKTIAALKAVGKKQGLWVERPGD